MITRRTLLQSIGVGTGLALLAACTPAAPQSATQAPAATKPGGTLRLGITSELPNLESHQMSPPTFNIIYQVHDRLIDYDDNLQPIPSLAESWQFSADHRQLTMKLRQGVKFHTGRELTSADIPLNIHHAADPKTGIGNLAVMSSWITDVQTPDRYTVVLVTEQPRPSLFDYLQFLNISDPETFMGPNAATKVVGTGPFEFIEWIQGDHVTLRKNRNYWKSGTPVLNEQQLLILKDPQAMVAQLEAGALDAAIGTPLRDVARLKGDPKYRYYSNPAAGTYTVLVANTTQPPLDRKEVRQAINYALDRKRVADTVYLGIGGTPKALPWTPQNPAYDATKAAAYAYDLDKARSMLQQAGVPNAQFDIILPSGGAELATIAQILQDDLAKLNITAGVKPLDTAPYNQTALSKQAWGLNVGQSLFTQLLPSTITVLSTYYQPTGPQTGFVDDGYTQLVNAIAVETDRAKQHMLYTQLNDILLDQCFLMPIMSVVPAVLSSARVQGITYFRNEGIDLRAAAVG
jgi:peptide/nickel transport system substrate-binding protein